nr:PREDICTED: cytochrome b5-related protein-like [Bemisia tabaci]
MVQTKLRSWPELKDPEYLRTNSFVTVESWIEGKQVDDGAEKLWRIHDKLYDFTEWIQKHPGGETFLRVSKGTDITELFEAHHVSVAAENLLPRFYVREAQTPRNSPYTFKDDGFFRVLKKRIREELPSVPKTVRLKSILIADSVVVTALTLLVIGSIMKSYLVGLAAGVPLTLGVITAHNFFHQKPNWRRFYFDLTFLSHREWIVSHVMSHHIYPNTKMDLEIVMFSPFLQWLPTPEKSWISRHLSLIYAPVVYGSLFFAQGIVRFLRKGFQSHDLANLVVPGVILVASSWDIMFTLKLWVGVIWVASSIFSFIGTTAAHHAPDLFHEGDVPREDRDWGLQQLDAVVDRKEISGSLPLTLFTFGDHTLHHLFPALDHAVLEHLHPTFEKVCAQFNVHHEATPYWTLIKGQFQQLARTTPRIFPLKAAEKQR